MLGQACGDAPAEPYLISCFIVSPLVGACLAFTMEEVWLARFGERSHPCT